MKRSMGFRTQATSPTAATQSDGWEISAADSGGRPIGIGGSPGRAPGRLTSRLVGPAPGTTAGPETPPLSAPAREDRLRPPWAAVSLWHTAQARCRIGWTSRAKPTVMGPAEPGGPTAERAVGPGRAGPLFPRPHAARVL